MITIPPIFSYKVFEDNQSFIEFVELKKTPTRTKHTTIKHHHFRGLLNKSVIKINYIDTKKESSDMLTNPVEHSQFFKLSFMLMG